MQRRVCTVGWRHLPRRTHTQNGVVRFSRRRLYASTAADEEGRVQIRAVGYEKRKTTNETSPRPQRPWYLYPYISARRVSEHEELGYKQKGLRMRDPEGEYCYFDEIYLRDSCRCPDCVDVHSGNKKFYTANIPRNITIREVQFNPANSPEHQCLKIKWARDVDGFGPDHETVLYPSSLVKPKEAYRTQTLASTPDPVIGANWKARDGEAAIKTFSYHDFTQDSQGFVDAISNLKTYGLIFVNDVPDSEESVVRIGNRIGPLKNTFYGYTWDVKDKPQAENVAYTSGYLGLHMDLLYMKQPPGLQLLHCIRSSEEGGESIFSDSFAAARIMRETYRSQFDLLASFEVPYHYNKGGHHYFDSKPTFDLGRDPGLHYFQKLSDMGPVRLQNVNWSPPFQGQFDYRALEDTKRLREYLVAAKIFHGIINRENMLYQRRLKPGECVIFNNRRILHGRQAFTSAGERFLKGAYIDSDPFDSLVTRLKMEGSWVYKREYGVGTSLQEQGLLDASSAIGITGPRKANDVHHTL